MTGSASRKPRPVAALRGASTKEQVLKGKRRPVGGEHHAILRGPPIIAGP
jgi:hypothetical protein